MLINLNEQPVKKYNSEHKLTKQYSGPVDLFKYEEVISFARVADGDQEESESESEEEEVWTDDEEWLP